MQRASDAYHSHFSALVGRVMQRYPIADQAEAAIATLLDEGHDLVADWVPTMPTGGIGRLQQLSWRKIDEHQDRFASAAETGDVGSMQHATAQAAHFAALLQTLTEPFLRRDGARHP